MALVTFLAVLTVAGLGIRSQVQEQSNKQHAKGLVQRLLDAEIAQVPGTIAEMEDYRTWTDPILNDAYEEAPKDSRQKLHASLALLATDQGQVDYLYKYLLNADPHEVPVIRDSLLLHKDELTERLWTVAESPNQKNQRLCVAAALASYDCNNPRWVNIRDQVAEELVSVNPVFLGIWLDALRPVKAKLVAPLKEVFKNRQGERAAERSLATNILADYAADQPIVLADLLMNADEKQFAFLFPKVAAHRTQVIADFQKKTAIRLTSEKDDELKEILAKQQANAGVALLRLGEPEKVWPLLKHQPDPRARSYLIHRLCPLGADPNTIIHSLNEEKAVSIRRALLLCLGEFDPNQINQREPIISRLLQLYQYDPDPGIHGAAEWLLRQWGQAKAVKGIDKKQATGKVKGNRDWYINKQGQTMVIMRGPVEFVMGSPPKEVGREGGAEGKNEVQHKKRIGRSFALANKEVTIEQFLRIVEGKKFKYGEQYAPSRDCPMITVSWYHAAAYCNFLSRMDGITKDQWCYEPTTKGYGEGMKAKANYLSLQGYRLPTESEWEYACRAGSVTRRYYGETDDLLGEYAWYLKTSPDRSRPVGALKPNDFGLFDMLGNTAEWCHDERNIYKPGDDLEQQGVILNRSLRIVRGGSFAYLSLVVRSALRSWIAASQRSHSIGFRPARTIRD